jgi:hypothetical protein
MPKLDKGAGVSLKRERSTSWPPSVDQHIDANRS